ncbi:iron chelate uptake ABC transporter family permease subunit [soil metagenome]
MTTLAAPHTPSTAEHVSAARFRRVRRRTTVHVGTGLLAFVLFVLTLAVGSVFVSPLDVFKSVFGISDDPLSQFIVRDLRLPTALTGLAVGMAFGMAGPMFQRMLRNPLASPDFVGISSGASLFAAAGIIVWHLSGVWVSSAALIGAAVSSLLIYLLAWKDGITGFRFILVGIGVSEFLLAINGYILARAQIWDAKAAMQWLIGSVGNAGSVELNILLVIVALSIPLVLMLDRPLRALELGDDQATALGSRVEVARFLIIALAVVLVAFATAAAGPIPFVALMAGPITARLLGPAGGGLIAAGFVGASIVLAADLVANHVMPEPMPTGVVTGLIGAPYLVWLLVTVNKGSGRGAS